MRPTGFMLCIVLVLAGCATSYEVRTDWDEGADFGAYRRWAFASGDASDTASPLDNTLVRRRVDVLLARHLAAEGLTHAATGETPDLLVRYWLGTREKHRVDRAGGASAWRDPFWPQHPVRWGASYDTVIVRNYTQGALVLDLIDARRDRLVWRAYLAGTLVDDRERMQEALDAALTRAFAAYPPQGG